MVDKGDIMMFLCKSGTDYRTYCACTNNDNSHSKTPFRNLHSHKLYHNRENIAIVLRKS